MSHHPPPPLRDLLQHVRQDDEVWLPSTLHSGRQSWLYRGAQALEAVHLWLYVLMGLGTFVAFWAAWWGVIVMAVAVAAIGWYVGWKNPAQEHDLPLEWNGWNIQVAQRTITRVGVPLGDDAQAIDVLHLEPPDAWSVGVLMGDIQTSKYIYAWRIELRHRSRGPVAVLCSVRSTSAAHVVLQDIDALVDALAQRLGVRRTGSYLHRKVRKPIPQKGGA